MLIGSNSHDKKTPVGPKVSRGFFVNAFQTETQELPYRPCLIRSPNILSSSDSA